MRSLVAYICAIALASQAAAGVVAQPSTPPAYRPDLLVVISDLHLGMGETEAGTYHPFEDFRWGEDFVAFLDALHRAGRGRTLLVVAGDMFELWQSDKGDCLSAAPKLGCSEAEAVLRIQRILREHRVEMQALGAFAAKADNRVVVIPGNHDAALLFPNVWAAVLSASRARPDRMTRPLDGRLVSPDGRVFIEHGHEFDEANRFVGWPQPYGQDSAGVRRLTAPFGERLVREFYDPIEREFPVMDNIAGFAGPLYGIRTKGIVGSAATASEFMKLLALKLSWRQFVSFLGPNDAPSPTWDLPHARDEGAQLLAKSVISDDPMTPLFREVVATYGPALSSTTAADLNSDDEMSILCQSRFVMYNEAVRDQADGAPATDPCPRTGGDLGYLRKALVSKVRGEDFYLYRHIEDKVAPTKEVQANKGRVLYVFGHSHEARRPTPVTIQGLERYTIANTGAWQRLISGASAAALGLEPKNVLKQLKLEDLPACYSLLWVKFDTSEPLEPKLRYWAIDKEGSWGFTTDCRERELLPAD